MIFSPGGTEPRMMRTSCLLGFKSVCWESIHFIRVICKDGPLSSFSFFLPVTPVHMFTPKPFQIPTHSCRLTGFYCPEVPLLFWLRTPHSWDSCTLRGSMKSSERAASSPDFPWIRSWHFNEGKDNVWTSASPGSRPSPCHRTPTSCPSTQHFILLRPPNKQTLECSQCWLGWWLPGCFPSLWHPMAPDCAEKVFCCCYFVLFLFLWMALVENADGSIILQPFIKRERKQTSLEIFWDTKQTASFLSSLGYVLPTECGYLETSCLLGFLSSKTWLATVSLEGGLNNINYACKPLAWLAVDFPAP